MSILSLSRKTLALVVNLLVILVMAWMGLLATSDTPGRAPAPEKKKDKYDRAIERGLEWLALHQARDGHWSLHEFPKHAREKPLPDGIIFPCNCEAEREFRNDIAATAFGLLPFLSAGYGPKPAKKIPDYHSVVEAGLNYLLAKQEKNGSFDKDMYANGLAARTLCDAYALTKENRLKESAQKALDFIADAQDPEGGGWRYAPRQAGDLSVTGWQFTALKHGQLAGLSVSRKTLKLAEKFLDSCETEKKGAYSYIPGSFESPSMTAVGLLCRQYSGVGPRNPDLRRGARSLQLSHPPGEDNNFYYLYYANQVMYHFQGEIWRYWDTGLNTEGERIHPGMRDWLLGQQDQGDKAGRGHQIGSWTSKPGGRIMATSLALLMLELPKHPPLYRGDRSALPESEK